MYMTLNEYRENVIIINVIILNLLSNGRVLIKPFELISLISTLYLLAISPAQLT